MNYYILDAAALICVLYCLRSWASARKRNVYNLPYPPGPPRLPILGNLLDMPGVEEWEKAIQWRERHGDLVYIENFGTPYLFINSYEATVELLDKRGHNYSARPRNTLLEMEGWRWLTTFMPYGEEHRKSRQFLHRLFQQSATADYYDLQVQSVRKLLVRLLKNPAGFADYIRQSAGEIIMMIAYGHEVEEDNDPFIEVAEKGVASLSQAECFFLVNFIPWLRFVPSWFPGAGFQKIADEGRRLSQHMLHEAHKMAKKQFFEGTAIPSMTSKLIEANLTEDGHITDEDIIAKSTGTAYAGGADTTVSSILTFFLAMVLYPEAQYRGQEELDKVIGKDNLPTMEDRASLPYIGAICSEILRWQTVTPLSVAHCAAKEDVLNGYYIPAGTNVLPNVWAMLRDPKDYPEPDKFIPERWLPSEGKKLPREANKLAFGFGRRICSGRHFAEDSIFIAVASILASFNIGKTLDEQGNPITPKEDYTPNFIRHPKPFKCKITPRSQKIEALIREAVETAK